MTVRAQRKNKPLPSFERCYRDMLVQYAEDHKEEGLRQAYELGRRGMAEGKSLLDIASLHHRALREILPLAKDDRRRQELLDIAGQFLAESLSPYEMAHRGFHEAIASLRQINETLEQEIKRIAHAVHDDAGQLLFAVHLALAEFTRVLPEPERLKVRQIEELLRQVEARLRSYSHELRPAMLDDLGWLAAIRFLAESVSKRSGMRIQVLAQFSDRLDASLETALYRIVQEGLNNAAKHSKAGNVHVGVARESAMLSCCISDDGIGFNHKVSHAEQNQTGLGLLGIQERLNAIGGTLVIESAPGRGTKLLVRFPLERGSADSYRPS
jgi:signal transduction histidine kinase